MYVCIFETAALILFYQKAFINTHPNICRGVQTQHTKVHHMHLCFVFKNDKYILDVRSTGKILINVASHDC